MKRRPTTLLGELESARGGLPPAGAPAGLSAGGGSWGRRAGLVAALAGVGLVAYTLLGFFFAPWLVRRATLEWLSSRVEGQATVARVAVNPFLLQVRWTGLALATTDGAEVLAVEEIFADARLGSLFLGSPDLEEVRVTRPVLALVRPAVGPSNLETLVAPALAAGGSTGAERGDRETSGGGKQGRFRLDRLQVVEGRITVADAAGSEPFAARLEPITFALAGISTRPGARGEIAFSAQTAEGARMECHGAIDWQHPGADLNLRVSGLSLPAFRAYWPEAAGPVPRQAVVDLDGRFRVSARPGDDPLLLQDGNLVVEGLELAPADPATPPLVRLRQVELQGLRASLLRREWEIGAVVVTEGELEVVKPNQGPLSLLALGPVRPAERTSAVASGGGPAWTGRIGEIRLAGLLVKAAYEEMQPALRANLRLEEGRAGPLAIPLAGQPVPVEALYQLEPGGRIHLRGEVVPGRTAARLRVEAEGIQAALLGPLLARATPWEARSGECDLRGELTLAPPAMGGQPPAFTWQGDLEVRGFRLEGPGPAPAFLAVPALEAAGHRVEAGAGPVRLTVPGLRLDGVELSVLRQPGGDWVLPFPLGKPASRGGADRAGGGAVGERTGGESPAGLALVLPWVEMTGATLVLRDESVQPAFRGTLTETMLRGRNLTWPAAGSMEGELRGLIEGRSALMLAGSWAGEGPSRVITLSAEVESLALPPLNGYLGPALGRTLEGGVLHYAGRYEARGSALRGGNQLRLDQVRMGAAVEAPGAPNLPLDLGLALLQDRAGRVSLDLPVQGDLTDPRLQISGLLVQALRGSLAKTLTAPFSLLGSLAGSNQQLSALGFAAGEADLPEDAAGSLGALAKALYERPGLSLRIRSLPGAADAPALARKALHAHLESLRRENPALPSGDFTRQPAVYRALLLAAGQALLPGSPGVGGEAGVAAGLSAPQASEASASQGDPWEGPARPESAPATAEASAATAGGRPNPVLEFIRNLFGGRDGAGAEAGGEAGPVTAAAPPAVGEVAASSADAPAGGGPAAGAAAPTTAAMEAALLAYFAPGEEALRALAAARARGVQAYLASTGQVRADQISPGEAAFILAGEGPPRVEFSLVPARTQGNE